MKTISYKLKAKNKGTKDSEGWEESISAHVEDNVTIEDHSKGIIDNWNNTLRPHDKERVLLGSIIDQEESNSNIPHDWSKTSLVTEGGGYDRMKCNICGATGKRHGIGNRTTIDKKHKGKKWEKGCPGPNYDIEVKFKKIGSEQLRSKCNSGKLSDHEMSVAKLILEGRGKSKPETKEEPKVEENKQTPTTGKGKEITFVPYRKDFELTGIIKKKVIGTDSKPYYVINVEGKIYYKQIV